MHHLQAIFLGIQLYFAQLGQLFKPKAGYGNTFFFELYKFGLTIILAEGQHQVRSSHIQFQRQVIPYQSTTRANNVMHCMITTPWGVLWPLCRWMPKSISETHRNLQKLYTKKNNKNNNDVSRPSKGLFRNVLERFLTAT